MLIETNFQPGDWIFVLDRNRVHKRLIIRVEVHVSEPTGTNNYLTPSSPVKIVVVYGVKHYESDKDLKTEYHQDLVFKTKEELLKSL